MSLMNSSIESYLAPASIAARGSSEPRCSTLEPEGAAWSTMVGRLGDSWPSEAVIMMISSKRVEGSVALEASMA